MKWRHKIRGDNKSFAQRNGHLLLLVVTCLLFAVSPYHGGVCPSGILNNNITLFGSKTRYENVANLNDDPLDSDGCTVKSIWMILRHGARQPEEEWIESMQTRLMVLRDKITQNRGTLCKEGINALKNWKFDINKEDAYLLAPKGIAEQTDLGRRWRNRLTSFWTEPFDHKQYLVRSTPSHRTEESAKAFIRGFFSKDHVSQMKLQVVDEGDPVLKPYKTCRHFIQTVEENPDTWAQREKFFKGKEMQEVLETIRERTGVKELQMADVELMYGMLRYEDAWSDANKSRISPWRSMFSEYDITVLSYLDNLLYYYRDGYWNELSAKIACETAQDMLQSLMENAAGKQYPKGVFSFSHSAIIWKLYSRLGLFRPSVAPNGSNFAVPETVIWNAGLLDPFSSNFAVVLFSCPSNSEPNKIQMFIQEKPVPSSVCGLSKCSLKTFQEFVSRDYHCELETLCKRSVQV